jgi:Protein of unknown function (DUF2723)
VPFIAYVLTCSAHAYWLDSGEFVAAAVRLDIAHPPGHPLTQLYGKAWSLLPLGPLPLRVALGQAFATALACALQCLACAAVLRRTGLAPALHWPCAVLGSWLSAFSYGLWFQAVRPEVYALQTLCTSVVLERSLAFLAAMSARRQVGQAPFATAVTASSALSFAGPVGIALGLGLANHHFTALLLLPALSIPLLALLRRAVRSSRTLWAAAALGGIALASYAYLPLRAARPLPVNLGRPDDLERFAWVVSARVYTQVIGRDAPQPLGERLADVLVLLVDDFGAVWLLTALVGLYALLRQPGTRLIGAFALAVIAPNLLARAWLGPVRSNPDVLGYFGPSFLLIGVLAGCALGMIADQIAAHAPRARRAVLLVPALALLGLPASAERATLAAFSATDLLDEPRLRSLPPRSLVVETMPQTVFRHWELDAVERTRPDLLQLPVPFLTHPAMRETVLRRQPELRALLDAYLQGDRLSAPPLIAAARDRPVWLELDLRTPTDVYAWLQPDHLLHRVQPEPALAPARLEAQLEHDYARLYARLGPAAFEIETQRQLLAIHYLNAVCFAARDERALAHAEIARAQHLAPLDRNVRALAAALDRPGAFYAEAFLDL